MMLISSRIRLGGDNCVHAADAPQAADHLRLLAGDDMQNVELISICRYVASVVDKR